MINYKLTFASAAIIATSSAIELEWRPKWFELNHFDSQEACDAWNTDSVQFVFSQSACACVADTDECDDNYLTMNGTCFDECTKSQIFDHGLTENCQIPVADQLLRRDTRRRSSRRARNKCSTRVYHSFDRVSPEEEVAENSDVEYEVHQPEYSQDYAEQSATEESEEDGDSEGVEEFVPVEVE